MATPADEFTAKAMQALSLATEMVKNQKYDVASAYANIATASAAIATAMNTKKTL